MLFVKRLLSVAGLNNKLIGYSVACISTTRPIYLVFSSSSDYPDYVIRKMSDEHDFHTHQVHRNLYQLVGDQVPNIVGIYEYEGDKYDVQHGVKGAPWFQIKSKIRTEEARVHLENRLWQTLTNFHYAIAADPAMVAGNAHETNDLQLHEELIHAYNQYRSTEHTPNTKLDKLVDLAVKDLSEMPACSRIPQHGDFCLNNLIIDKSHVTVIDFEDFAITTMPMYDYFSLALSLPSCSDDPSLAVNVLNSTQIAAAAKGLEISIDAIQWHFLHHLLLRLGPWSAGEKRSHYREWLNKILQSFINNHMKNSGVSTSSWDILQKL